MSTTSAISKIWGGSLIFAGTCIGAAMLALPTITASSGFILTTLLFILFWGLTLMVCLYIVELKTWLTEGSNLISMAEHTLGTLGKSITWIGFLVLLYAINTAYLVGGSPVISQIAMHITNVYPPVWLSAGLFASFIGVVIYLGTSCVDYLNRWLMFGLITTYLILVIANLPHVQVGYLKHHQLNYTFGIISLALASFSAQMVIPSLCDYLHNDYKSLILTMIIGCTIPLIVYLIWEMIILGVIPLMGAHGLIAISHSSHQVAKLNDELRIASNSNISGYGIELFSHLALVTSFLGITLSLTDFLQDGLGLTNRKFHRIICIVLSLLPPLIITLYFEAVKGFFNQLMGYAGTLSCFVLIIMPLLMVWRGRYSLNLSTENGYTVFGNKFILLLIIIISLLSMSLGILDNFHLLPKM